MASRIAEAYVQITPRIDGIAASLNRQLSTEMATAGDAGGAALAAGTASGFSSRIKGLLGPALIGAGLVATAAVGSFFTNAVSAASDFAEQGAAVGQVFGDAANTIKTFASGSATALGQSSTQVLEAAKQFGIYGGAAGLAGEENAKFSTDLVTLATDLASFNNTSVDDAILALGSGLRGEAEPLRRYGVLLDDATLKAKALEMGLITNTKDALSPQNKVLAANGVIMEQTSIQQGDFARTSEGLANQQRILQANMAELGITVGTALLPIMTDITSFMNTSVIPAFTTIFEGIQNNIPTIATFVGVLGGLLTIFNAVRIATGLWSIAQGILNAVMAMNPFTLIAIAVAALVAAIVWVATNTTFFQDTWETMTQVIGDAWDGLYNGFIKPIADAIGAAFAFLWENILYPVYIGIMLYIGLWAAAFQALYDFVIKPVADLIAGIFMALWTNFIKPVVDFVVGAFEWLGGAFTALWTDIVEPGIDAMGSGFVALWNNFIKPAIDWVVGGFKFMGEVIGNIFTGISTLISNVFQGLIGIIRGPVNVVIGFINTLIDGLNKIKIDIPDWVPEWGGKRIGFNLAKIPQLAEGGFVDSPTTALIGEAGPEVVMPLNRFESLMGIGSGSGQTINYYAAPNQSLDAEQALLQAVKRARVITGW
jgi:hypothetical protein